MGVFKKKNKVKVKKERNVMRIIYVITFIGIIVFAAVYSLFQSIYVYKDLQNQLNEFIELVSIEVDENDFIKNNSIRDEDYVSLKVKSQDCGFMVYTDDVFDKTKLDAGNIDLSADMSLMDYELGALINLYENNETNGWIKYLEISITCKANSNYDIYSVIRLDLPTILSKLGAENTTIKYMYLISESEVNPSGEVVSSSALKINNLTGENLQLVTDVIESAVIDDINGTTADNFSAVNIIDFIKMVNLKTGTSYAFSDREVEFVRS